MVDYSKKPLEIPLQRNLDATVNEGNANDVLGCCMRTGLFKEVFIKANGILSGKKLLFFLAFSQLLGKP